MFLLKKIQKKPLYYLFILVWVFLLAGINVNTDYYYLKRSYQISDILYSLRLYIQFIIFLVLIFFNIYFFKKINFNFFFKIFFVLNIVQIISLFLSLNSNYNLIYNIQTFNILLFLNIFVLFFSDKLLDLLFVLLFFLLGIFLYFYFENIYFLFEKNIIFYGHYNSSPILLDAIKNPPRSSGLARMALILFLTSIFFIEYKNKKKILFTIILLFSTPIFLFQSRTIVFIYLFILFLLSFSHQIRLYNLALNNYKYNLVNFILYPILFFFLISNLQPKNFYFLLKKSNFNVSSKILNIDTSSSNKNKVFKDYRIFRINDKKSISSGRFEDWNKIININNRYFIGHGTQGDRFLIKQTASNSLIYTYSSCGIIGVSLFFFLIYKILNMIFINKKYFYNNNNYNKKIIFSFYLLLIFLLRSTLENSFLVFGIDQIIFFIIIYYLILKFNFKKINQP